MSPLARNILIWLMIALAIAGIYNMFNPSGGMGGRQVAYSDFMRDASESKIKSVSLQGDYILGQYSNGEKFTVLKPSGEQIADQLIKNNVRVDVKPQESGMGGLFGVLLSWFPMLLLIGVWIFFMRQMQGKGGGGALSSASRAPSC
jgi:cell division protease FtsH